MYRMRIILCCLLINGVFCHTQPSNRIAVIGSSSAAGYGVSSAESWAGRIKTYYKGLSLIDTLYNLAQSSTTCYSGMPTGYTPPPGRPAPDPSINITKALSLTPKPSVIIVNYPTNGYDYMSVQEVLNCLQLIKNTANAENVYCYITTTQPRDGFSPAERLRLKELRDSVMNRFGSFAIDFFTPVVQEPALTIQPAYALGDGVHLNASGHAVLAQQVINKNIFSALGPLPLVEGSLKGYKTAAGIRLNWESYGDAINTRIVIEKNRSGQNFDSIGAVVNSNYEKFSFTDHFPEKGNNIYRLRYLNPYSTDRYSSVINIVWTVPALRIISLFPNPVTNGKATLRVQSEKDVAVKLTIENMAGQLLSARQIRLLKGSADIPLDIPHAGSMLILKLITPESEQQYFILQTGQ